MARQSKGRLPSRVMFGTMAGGETLRPGEQFNTWHRCVVEDLREFRATERSTEHSPLVFGDRAVVHCSKKRVEVGTGGSLRQPNGSW